MLMTSNPSGEAFTGRAGNAYQPAKSVDVAQEDVALALRFGWTTTTELPEAPVIEVVEKPSKVTPIK